jgi:hypothetical protein
MHAALCSTALSTASTTSEWLSRLQVEFVSMLCTPAAMQLSERSGFIRFTFKIGAHG